MVSLKKKIYNQKSNPRDGCTAIPRGLTRLVLNSSRLIFESKFATSIVSLDESVQYMFLEDQSIAIPSGEPIS